MILHPAVSEISVRRDRVAEAIAKGHLTPDVSRYMHHGWAHILKFEGSPSLAFPSIGNFDGADGDDTLYYVITTNVEDRDGDIVRPLGANLKNYAPNPVVFFGHQEKPIPIGVCRSSADEIMVYPKEDQVTAGICFDREDPDADFIYGKCRRKILNATSIAFVPIEAWRRDDVRKARTHSEQQGQLGWYFNQWDMTELSIVGVPSNPNAVGLEKDLQGACRDVFDREKSFMSMSLQKAWQPYVAQAKGCFAGWCPIPGDEKDIGGGVVLKAVKTCSCDDCTAGKACGCAKAVWPWSGKSEEIKRRRLEQLDRLVASGEGEPDDYQELTDLKRDLGVQKSAKKSRHPFEVRQSGEDWFVYDGGTKVSDALDSREEAEGYAAALWQEQNKSTSKAMRRAEFERLWNGAPTEQQLDRAASELSRTSREDIEELAGIAGVRGGWEEVYDALERRSKMKSVKTKDVPCPRCKGEGTIKISGEEQQCPRCNGAGVMFAASKAATQADLDSPGLPGRKVNPEEKAIGESDGRIGGYTVPPGGVQSDKDQEQLDDPQPEGWATCESCHGDGNCGACGGVGEGCDECGGSGECGACAGEGHVEKGLASDRTSSVLQQGNKWWVVYSGTKLGPFSSQAEAEKYRQELVQKSKGQKYKQLEEPPKPSTPQVLAALYSHAKAEAAYIDQLDDQFKDTLADYRRQQLDERMASLKAMFRTTERDDEDLEKLCKEFEEGVDNKGFESTGPDSVVEPGEAGMVEQGQIPDTELEDTMKQDIADAAGAYTEDDPEEKADAPFNKAAPGTEEWAEEEMQEPEHKAGNPGDEVDEGPTVYNKEDDESEEKAPGEICMCGAEIPEGATECPGCGAPVEKAEEPLDDVPVEMAMDEEVETPVDDIPKDSDPSTEEILERYQHPKSHKWATRKHRVSKSLLPFLKYRKAANGQKYLVRSTRKGDIVQGNDGEDPTISCPECGATNYADSDKCKSCGAVLRKKALDDSEVKSLTTKLASAIDDLKSLFKARETPKHFKPALKHIADQLWYVGKALTDKGKEQKQGGSGSELNDKGKEQRTGGKGSELKDKGEQQGKTPTKSNGRKVSPVVERKLQETLAKLKRFGVLNGR